VKAALLVLVLLSFAGAACYVWLGLVEFFRLEASRFCPHCEERERVLLRRGSQVSPVSLAPRKQPE
jgi:hypothetical protein